MEEVARIDANEEQSPGSHDPNTVPEPFYLPLNVFLLKYS